MIWKRKRKKKIANKNLGKKKKKKKKKVAQIRISLDPFGCSFCTSLLLGSGNQHN
jgi:hypothetical protein